MQSKTRLSTTARAITYIIIGTLIIACIATFGKTPAFYFVLAIFLCLLLFGFLFAPMGIQADKSCITIKALLKNRKIPMNNVESVQLFQPTMGAIRICGSGGYMGYWGIFKEGDIGRYCAYYGKASDCFLVKLKNGDKYVLGCENPSDMVARIASHIQK